ncbi:MAG: type III secretion system effector protein [Myxococcota bacterium]
MDPAASPEFRARVESDIEALRSLPSGRQLLRDLDATGRTTTITETTGFPEAGYTTPGDRFRVPDPANPGSFVNGPGTDATVRYNPNVDSVPTAQAWGDFPPIVGLFHELVHAEDAGNGAMYPGNDPITGERRRERQAVGLPIDHDGNPATPTIQPNTNSENGLRDELNLERRTQYSL